MNNNAYRTFGKLYLTVLVCISFFSPFLFLSCGLDVYFILPAPSSVNHTPVISYSYDNAYFEFFTNENFENTGGVSFKGTEVYYKIYSSSSVMTSEVETLQSLASSDDTSSTAPTRLITSYGYKALRVQNSTESPLISFSGHSQLVYIRLSDYLDMDEYSAKILVDGENIYDSDTRMIPVRNISEQGTFNFGRSGTKDLVPKSTDDDVKYTSMSDGNKWYVAMFAVAVGMDYLYTPHYSNILYLGAVTIDADSENN
ncbi:MAG: hypothetical protein IJ688_02745 [Treponema sp.]|nr:hypothetical protein [Treponema sp.]